MSSAHGVSWRKSAGNAHGQGWRKVTSSSCRVGWCGSRAAVLRPGVWLEAGETEAALLVVGVEPTLLS